jgi:hypothetical protein
VVAKESNVSGSKYRPVVENL